MFICPVFRVQAKNCHMGWVGPIAMSFWLGSIRASKDNVADHWYIVQLLELNDFDTFFNDMFDHTSTKAQILTEWVDMLISCTGTALHQLRGGHAPIAEIVDACDKGRHRAIAHGGEGLVLAKELGLEARLVPWAAVPRNQTTRCARVGTNCLVGPHVAERTRHAAS